MVAFERDLLAMGFRNREDGGANAFFLVSFQKIGGCHIGKKCCRGRRFRMHSRGNRLFRKEKGRHGFAYMEEHPGTDVVEILRRRVCYRASVKKVQQETAATLRENRSVAGERKSQKSEY